MSTILLFKQDVYMKETTATVVDFFTEKNAVVLDRTIFFPGGGGQSCDLGTIDDVAILSVYEKDDIIYHIVEKPLKKGATVKCVLNWSRRFDNMQRHCGEHILSGMFYREYGGINCGFHMGEEYMTIDISLQNSPSNDRLTWDMAMHVERCTNEAIWKNLPVTTRLFSSKKDTKAIPLRKPISFEGQIFVVCVGDQENASDCVACCGTHPSTSGQVGLVKIFKVEKSKKYFRVFFEAGGRAMADYDAKHQLIAELGTMYSSSKDNLIEKLSAIEAKNKDIRNRFTILKRSVTAQRAADIRQKTESDSGGTGFYTYTYDDLSVDDAIHIGRAIEGHIAKLLCISIPQELTVLLFSDGKKVHCGNLVRDNASIYRGKGGGSAVSARAIFPSVWAMKTFVDLLEKHLR